MTPPSIKLLTQDLLDDVAHQSKLSPRLRKNYNFHELSERVQRFINVLQPGSYVRPHRHIRSADMNGFEFFLVLQGDIGILIFDESGRVEYAERLTAQGSVRGIELAEGTYHTLIALAPDTVMLEMKEGPYSPSSDKEFLAAFPPEGSAEIYQLVADWERLFGVSCATGSTIP
ncbi:MAG: WbuC family cupin fold metalloprotein [Elainellaceae cyanobacterium]